MKNRKFCLYFLFFSFFTGEIVFGDEAFPANSLASNLSYREEVDRRVVQTLSWEKDERALNYLVEIQEKSGNGWANILNKVTEGNTVEVSLPHGSYRYRVIPSDLLGRRLTSIPWSELAILQLRQPELTNCVPGEFILDGSKGGDFTVKLYGSNILSESKALMRDGEGGEVFPQSYTAAADGKSAVLVYKKTSLKEGNFELVIENPGGLKSELKNFRIYNNKDLPGAAALSDKRFYISEAYAPFVAFKGLFNDFFERNFFELGFKAALGWLPLNILSSYAGPELVLNYHYLSKPVKDRSLSTYKINAHVVDIGFNFSIRRALFERFMFIACAGPGFTFFADVHLEEGQIKRPSGSGFMASLSAGLSGAFLIRESLYIEAGADFLYVFSVDTPAPAYIIPFAALGFKF